MLKCTRYFKCINIRVLVINITVNTIKWPVIYYCSIRCCRIIKYFLKKVLTITQDQCLVLWDLGKNCFILFFFACRFINIEIYFIYFKCKTAFKIRNTQTSLRPFCHTSITTNQLELWYMMIRQYIHFIVNKKFVIFIFNFINFVFYID